VNIGRLRVRVCVCVCVCVTLAESYSGLLILPTTLTSPSILKCVPACLAQHSVQGKGFCFDPPTHTHRLFPLSQPTNGVDGDRRVGGGGMTNGLGAASREGRRCQSHESGDARVPPHPSPSFSSFSIHNAAPPSPSPFPFQCVCVCLRRACPDSAQSAFCSPPHPPTPLTWSPVVTHSVQ